MIYSKVIRPLAVPLLLVGVSYWVSAWLTANQPAGLNAVEANTQRLNQLAMEAVLNGHSTALQNDPQGVDGNP